MRTSQSDARHGEVPGHVHEARGVDSRDKTLVDAELAGPIVSPALNAVVRQHVKNVGNNTAWNMDETNCWTGTGGFIKNPSNATAGQTGIIYFNGAATSWDTYFKFSGGVAPDVPANSVVPYYVYNNNTILIGNPTISMS